MRFLCHLQERNRNAYIQIINWTNHKNGPSSCKERAVVYTQKQGSFAFTLQMWQIIDIINSLTENWIAKHTNEERDSSQQVNGGNELDRNSQALLSFLRMKWIFKVAIPLTAKRFYKITETISVLRSPFQKWNHNDWNVIMLEEIRTVVTFMPVRARKWGPVTGVFSGLIVSGGGAAVGFSVVASGWSYDETADLRRVMLRRMISFIRPHFLLSDSQAYSSWNLDVRFKKKKKKPREAAPIDVGNCQLIYFLASQV